MPEPAAAPDPNGAKLNLDDGSQLNITGWAMDQVRSFSKEYRAATGRPEVQAKVVRKWAGGVPGMPAGAVITPEPKPDPGFLDEVVHRANPIEMFKGMGHLIKAAVTNPGQIAENYGAIQQAIRDQGEKDIAAGNELVGQARVKLSQIPLVGPVANEVVTALEKKQWTRALGIIVGEGVAALEGEGIGRLAGSTGKALGRMGKDVYETAIPAMKGVGSAERAAMAARGIEKGSTIGFNARGDAKLATVAADAPEILQQMANTKTGSLSPPELLKAFDEERAAAMAALPEGAVKKVEEAVGRKTTATTRTVGETTPSETVAMTTSKAKSVKKGGTTTREAESETLRQPTPAKRTGEVITETQVTPGKPATVLTEAEQKVADSVAAIDAARDGLLNSLRKGGKGAIRNVQPGEAMKYALEGGKPPPFLELPPKALAAREKLADSFMDAMRTRFPDIGEELARGGTAKSLREAVLQVMGQEPKTFTQVLGMASRPAELLNHVLFNPAVRARMGILLAQTGRGAAKLAQAKVKVAAFAADVAKIAAQQQEQAGAPQE